MTCRRVMERHASIRRFSPDPIPEEHVREILWAASRAPTAWGLQPFSVAVVRDAARRRAIAEAVGGQRWVEEAPLFLAFLVDYAKLLEAARGLGLEAGEVTLGHLAAALIDVGIASSWALLRAEELGYGAVYIALYSACRRVAEILGAGPLQLPVVGLAVGKPAESPGPRPRQPLEALAADETPPEPRRAAEAILTSPYRAKLEAAAPYTLTPRSYYARVAEELEACARGRGFRL